MKLNYLWAYAKISAAFPLSEIITTGTGGSRLNSANINFIDSDPPPNKILIMGTLLCALLFPKKEQRDIFLSSIF